MADITKDATERMQVGLAFTWAWLCGLELTCAPSQRNRARQRGGDIPDFNVGDAVLVRVRGVLCVV